MCVVLGVGSAVGRRLQLLDPGLWLFGLLRYGCRTRLHRLVRLVAGLVPPAESAAARHTDWTFLRRKTRHRTKPALATLTDDHCVQIGPADRHSRWARILCVACWGADAVRVRACAVARQSGQAVDLCLARLPRSAVIQRRPAVGRPDADPCFWIAEHTLTALIRSQARRVTRNLDRLAHKLELTHVRRTRRALLKHGHQVAIWRTDITRWSWPALRTVLARPGLRARSADLPNVAAHARSGVAHRRLSGC